jgi:hypothetical protein
MKNVRSALISSVAFLIFLAGCSSSAPTASSENKQAQATPAFQPTFLTGREALQKMYIAARSWAPDAKPYNLESIATKEDDGQDGKSGIWGAGFASATKRSVKVFSWSGVKSDNAPEPGVSSRPEDTYNPGNTSTAVFDMAYLKIDSGGPEKTTALSVAEQHGGEKLLKSDKETMVFYKLKWNPRENKLIWRVSFGVDPNQPKLSVDVDGSTGAFIKVEK